MKNFDARDLNLHLAPERLKPLFKTNPLRHGFSIFYNWVIIGSTIAFAIQFPNPLLYFVAILIIGARMHALAILMHDATHFRFLKNRKWNDFITNVTTMYPLFLTIENYRDNHLKHHQNLNTDEDPDWVSKMGRSEFTFPQTKWDFIRQVLSYFLLVQGVKDAIWFISRFNMLGGKKKNKKATSPVWKIGFYLSLVVILTVSGGWLYFLLYWIVPYFSTFLMFQYIRSVSEHFGEMEYDHLLTATRTVKTNILERFFIAPHNVGYHIEHHLYPGVPYYHLPQLHNLLMETDVYAQRAHLTKGYLSGLLNELS